MMPQLNPIEPPMLPRFLTILEITLPVFMLIGLGKTLELRGMLNEDRRVFINNLVFYLALPALILREVARQDVQTLCNIPLIMVLILSTLGVVILQVFLARWLQLSGPIKAAFIFGTFWANITYLGFPLAENAFGGQGLALAAVFNAVALPAYLILAYFFIGRYNGGKQSLWQSLKLVSTNPVLIAALLGVIIALVRTYSQGDKGQEDGVYSQAFFRLASSSLGLIGSMGLPLGLLSIGAALRMSSLKNNWGLLSLIIAAKLMVLPGLAFLVFWLFFPSVDRASLGVTVLLSGMPSAVASYVIAVKIGVEDSFVCSMLVISTLMSMLTIPFWLFVVL
ncbi:MAG: AEC family transporter [Planctomycetes bacterium]|nr:AEC family transporter [Planctomycetota bacterium]